MKAGRLPNGRIRPVSDYSDDEYKSILSLRLFGNCVLSPSGCLEWQGCLLNGYGQIRVRKPVNKLFLTHRLSWIMKNGDIPEGFEVCHKCDNPKCINVDHLFLGTRSDNMNDMVSKKRNADFKGMKSGKAKINDDQVIKIRSLYSSGIKQSEIALIYGLSAPHVSRLISGERWGHI